MSRNTHRQFSLSLSRSLSLSLSLTEGMPVSYSSSASASDICSMFSSSPHYASHTSSSSVSSSPSSSPHSEPRSSTSSPYLVPFLWEEKPGVLKKEVESEPTGSCHAARQLRETHVAEEHHKKLGGKFAPTSHSHRSSSKISSKSILPLRPPPYLNSTRPELEYCQLVDEYGAKVQRPHHHYNHSQAKSTSGFISTAMSSLSLMQKGKHNKSPSLEDDPFWLAMVACQDHESAKAGRTSLAHIKGNKYLSKVERDRMLLKREADSRDGGAEVQSTSRAESIDLVSCGPCGSSKKKKKSHFGFKSKHKRIPDILGCRSTAAEMC